MNIESARSSFTEEGAFVLVTERQLDSFVVVVFICLFG